MNQTDQIKKKTSIKALEVALGKEPNSKNVTVVILLALILFRVYIGIVSLNGLITATMIPSTHSLIHNSICESFHIYITIRPNIFLYYGRP